MSGRSRSTGGTIEVDSPIIQVLLQIPRMMQIKNYGFDGKITESEEMKN
jgi:hypothetical protein